MIIGQTLMYSGTPYYTPWMRAGGNGAAMALDVIGQIGSGTVTVTVETKKSGDDDTTLGGTTWGSGAQSTAGASTFWKAGEESGDGTTAGFNDLVRLKIDIGGSAGSDGVHFQVHAPRWL